jgi:glycosyltransferase involved in cell wall biosynthesis
MSGETESHEAPEPLVSAIIIFLDAEAFLAESIESVLAQTYRNIELLLVDDGSTDGSTGIARRYARQAPDRIRLLEHPGHENRGMSASRNLGVEQSRGELLAFLDSDDVWLPEKTEQQVAIFREHPGLGMVYGRTQIWHSWSNETPGGKDFFYGLGVPASAIYPPPTMLGNLIENKHQSPTTCNAMISREAFAKVGGFEPSFRSMYEDQAFFSKLYLEFPAYVSDCYWARYRQHPGNSGNKFSQATYFQERAQFMEFVFRHMRPHWSRLDQRTRSLIRRDLWRARHPALATWLLRLRTRLQKLSSR